MSKPRLREALVVEGRYDKNTLSQLVDGVILETRGFGVFRDRELLELLRFYARTRGLIVLTDGDGAGFLIRKRLRGSIPPEQLKHAYIPDIYGKEKRKRTASREGKLGVEGMPPEILYAALRRAGAGLEDAPPPAQAAGLSKADFYALGLSGGADSTRKRRELAEKLGLPERIGADGLLDAVNTMLWAGELSLSELLTNLNADR